MATISSLFRKYHRQLSIMVSFPLLLMAVTGTISPILEEMHFNTAVKFIRRIHSGKIFFGSGYVVYSALSGLALLGLLVTGFSMLRPFNRRKRQ
jgi:uncharacterized iron-regulated membrane protein